MTISRRTFLRQLTFSSVGATAGTIASQTGAQASEKAEAEVEAQLSIPDDWWIGGYKTCYHGRGNDPKHFVDLVTVVGRTGGCSAGFIRRWIIAIADGPKEAKEGVAYLNRGIRHGWLIHGRPRSSGMPLGILKQSHNDVPS
jgi:hypothetical protein